jgi:hypothetical protein
MELMDRPLYPNLAGKHIGATGASYNWFCENAEKFDKVDKHASKEMADKYNCEVKSCYYNVFNADIQGKYRYFEGYVIDNNLPLAVQHCWLVDRNGIVVDPTLIIPVDIDLEDGTTKHLEDRCGDTYIGVEIPREWVNKTAFKLERTGDFINEWFEKDTKEKKEKVAKEKEEKQKLGQAKISKKRVKLTKPKLHTGGFRIDN